MESANVPRTEKQLPFSCACSQWMHFASDIITNWLLRKRKIRLKISKANPTNSPCKRETSIYFDSQFGRRKTACTVFQLSNQVHSFTDSVLKLTTYRNMTQGETREDAILKVESKNGNNASAEPTATVTIELPTKKIKSTWVNVLVRSPFAQAAIRAFVIKSNLCGLPLIRILFPFHFNSVTLCITLRTLV